MAQELKAGVIVTPHDEGMCFNRGSDVIAVTERETEFYLKSEADKVLLHHARKRCLAMANACDLDALYSNLKMSFVVAKAEQPKLLRHWSRMRKWHKRWLSLAAEPTWQRFLQLIHKEAK